MHKVVIKCCNDSLKSLKIETWITVHKLRQLLIYVDHITCKTSDVHKTKIHPKMDITETEKETLIECDYGNLN